MSERSANPGDLDESSNQALIDMITKYSSTLKRIKYDYRNKKKLMDQEMLDKDTELEKVRQELERVVAINKEWESAHMERMKRTKHESPRAKAQAAADLEAERTEAATLRADLAKQAREMTALQDRYEAELAAQRRELDEIRSELDTANQYNADWELAYGEVEQKAKIAEESCDAKRQQLAQLTRDSNTKITQLNQEIQGLKAGSQSESSEAKQTITGLQDIIQAQKQEVIKIATQCTQLKQDHSSSQADHGRRNAGLLGQLEKANADHEKAKVDTQSALDGQTQLRAQLEAERLSRTEERKKDLSAKLKIREAEKASIA